MVVTSNSVVAYSSLCYRNGTVQMIEQCRCLALKKGETYTMHFYHRGKTIVNMNYQAYCYRNYTICMKRGNIDRAIYWQNEHRHAYLMAQYYRAAIE